MRPVAVLLHGVLRTRFSLWWMEKALQKAGFETFNKSYPWRAKSLGEISKQLQLDLKRFDGRDLYFITHSFGSIVLRNTLRKYPALNAKRAVLLAPPSRGSCIAERHRGNPLLRKVFLQVYGKAALRLTPVFVDKLPAPFCEFGVIAGGKGQEKGFSRFLEGDNDGVVRVEETKLPGMADFVLLPHAHSFIMYGKDTIRLTIRFLQTGKF